MLRQSSLSNEKLKSIAEPNSDEPFTLDLRFQNRTEMLRKVHLIQGCEQYYMPTILKQGARDLLGNNM